MSANKPIAHRISDDTDVYGEFLRWSRWPEGGVIAGDGPSLLDLLTAHAERAISAFADALLSDEAVDAAEAAEDRTHGDPQKWPYRTRAGIEAAIRVASTGSHCPTCEGSGHLAVDCEGPFSCPKCNATGRRVDAD